MTRTRARLARAALMTAAVAATAAVVPAALATGAPAATTFGVTASPPTSVGPPGPAPTGPAPTEPAPTTTAPVTPSPTVDPPGPGCDANSPIGGHALGRSAAMAGPVTCDDGEAAVTVGWDGKQLTITIAGADGSGCALDPNSVKASEPKDAKVDNKGQVTLPYDPTKKAKITIKIDYDLTCLIAGERVTRRNTATVEFTPPDGPVRIGSRPR
jgi:hypothetical protein